jgi:hypothetical protein
VRLDLLLKIVQRSFFAPEHQELLRDGSRHTLVAAWVRTPWNRTSRLSIGGFGRTHFGTSTPPSHRLLFRPHL